MDLMLFLAQIKVSSVDHMIANTKFVYIRLRQYLGERLFHKFLDVRTTQITT